MRNEVCLAVLVIYVVHYRNTHGNKFGSSDVIIQWFSNIHRSVELRSAISSYNKSTFFLSLRPIMLYWSQINL